MADYKDQIYDDLNREYTRIREANKQKHEKEVADIYITIPRIKDIDEEINSIGMGVASAVIEGEISPEKAVENMRLKMNSLNEEKAKLLSEAGYKPNAMNEIYSCELCRDKGYANGKRCVCYNQKLYRLLQKYSNISMSEKNTFKSFNINLYSDKPHAKYGISPKDNMKSVYKIAVSFADCGEASPKYLLFYGGTGLGKTFTSDCIAKKWIESGKTVFYMSAPKMFSIFEDYKFGRDTSAATRRIIDSVSNSELLIIDDLGTEFRTAYTDSILFDIINSRLIEEKRMIISTNLTTKELRHSYSERICSRIFGSFTEVLFFGEDLRLKG